MPLTNLLVILSYIPLCPFLGDRRGYGAPKTFSFSFPPRAYLFLARLPAINKLKP